jgi:lipooligosaccharide transport system ATP-binding protein
MSPSIVETRAVAKRFGDRPAVADLDLAVPAGLCFGLLGPNGAGKTTTLRMIYGVTRPSAGTVRVFGIDVAMRPRAVRARLGVTLQETILLETATAADNLRIFGRYHLLKEPELSRRIDEVVASLELSGHVDRPVRTLSGGFRRRLAIAMSLMNRPELLILDEPTTGLDPAVRHALWARVRGLISAGTTVLLTTHYMDEAERLCDTVVIMAQGHAVCRGAPKALIAEHLAREAVEFDCSEGDERRLLDGIAAKRLRTGNRLMLFADDASPLVDLIHRRDGGDRRPVVVRPANLEDVFLSVTGGRLEEDADAGGSTASHGAF